MKRLKHMDCEVANYTKQVKSLSREDQVLVNILENFQHLSVKTAFKSLWMEALIHESTL